MADLFVLAGVAIFLLILAFVLFIVNKYTGILAPIEIKTCTPPLNEAIIAYKFYRGSYKECGSAFGSMAMLIPPSYKCLGIYYDNPYEVEKQNWHKLRYVVGAILSENGSEIDEEVKKRLTENGYKIHELTPVSKAVYTTFPNRSSLSLHVAMARVYPKFDKYVEKHNLHVHPNLEIYAETITHFIGPLSHQDQFYVEEYKDTLKKD